MKRDQSVATLRPVAASTAGGNPALKSSSAKNGEREDRRTWMTRGELMFCLREVRSYWSTPHISDQEIEELARRNLIERRASGICALRLTEEGARVKNGHALKATRNNGSSFSPGHDEKTARLSQ